LSRNVNIKGSGRDVHKLISSIEDPTCHLEQLTCNYIALDNKHMHM